MLAGRWLQLPDRSRNLALTDDGLTLRVNVGVIHHADLVRVDIHSAQELPAAHVAVVVFFVIPGDLSDHGVLGGLGLLPDLLLDVLGRGAHERSGRTVI
ncbi:MAG: hypothetical protein WCD21_12980 [Streptomyces sp.]